MSEKLVDMIRRHEGFRSRVYQDTKGILTIGVGRNIQEKGITRAEADYLRNNDLVEAEVEAGQAFAWFNDLNRCRQAAIIDLVFNMGMGTFKTFKKTIAFMNAGDYTEAGAELLRGGGEDGKSLYWIQVGDRAVEIAYMISKGEWR